MIIAPEQVATKFRTRAQKILKKIELQLKEVKTTLSNAPPEAPVTRQLQTLYNDTSTTLEQIGQTLAVIATERQPLNEALADVQENIGLLEPEIDSQYRLIATLRKDIKALRQTTIKKTIPPFGTITSPDAESLRIASAKLMETAGIHQLLGQASEQFAQSVQAMVAIRERLALQPDVTDPRIIELYQTLIRQNKKLTALNKKAQKSHP